MELRLKVSGYTYKDGVDLCCSVDIDQFIIDPEAFIGSRDNSVSDYRISKDLVRQGLFTRKVVVVYFHDAEDYEMAIDLIPPNWLIADENKLSSKSTLPTTKGVDDSNDQEKLQKDSRETEKEGS